MVVDYRPLSVVYNSAVIIIVAASVLWFSWQWFSIHQYLVVMDIITMSKLADIFVSI